MHPLGGPLSQHGGADARSSSAAPAECESSAYRLRAIPSPVPVMTRGESSQVQRHGVVASDKLLCSHADVAAAMCATSLLRPADLLWGTLLRAHATARWSDAMLAQQRYDTARSTSCYPSNHPMGGANAVSRGQSQATRAAVFGAPAIRPISTRLESLSRSSALPLLALARAQHARALSSRYRCER